MDPFRRREFNTKAWANNDAEFLVAALNIAEPSEALLDAARIVIPELVAETKGDGYRQTIVYRDVAMPPGTNLWFPWSVIGRDSTVIEDADSFLPRREQKHPHVGFALGAHMCLGQFIARAQLAEGLHLIAQRMKNPRSPGPLGRRPFPGVWGISGLPIEFDPA